MVTTRIRYPKLRSPVQVSNEFYDKIYHEIVSCWALLPKDDFLVCSNFISASVDYLNAMAEIFKCYEERANTDD